MLDASAAFDTVCWGRIRDQFLERNVPFYLIKLCMKQLTSNRISVSGTTFIYPTAGIKQGGVISGYYFSLCYDELVDILILIGAGTLLVATTFLCAMTNSSIFLNLLELVLCLLSKSKCRGFVTTSRFLECFFHQGVSERHRLLKICACSTCHKNVCDYVCAMVIP